MKKYIEMEKWFNELVREFQIRNKDLPKEKQKKILGLADFKKPLQINILSFIQPEYGYIFITHFKKIDYHICAYGPFKSKNAKKKLEKFSLLPFLNKKREKLLMYPTSKTYREVVQSFFITYKPGHSNMNGIWDISKPHFGGGLSLSNIGESGIIYYGNLLSIPPSEFLNRMLARPKPTLQKGKVKKPGKQETIKSYFTSFYPPIQIGTIKYSFSERFDKKTYQFDHKKKIQTWKYDFIKWKLFFQQNGRIIITGDNKWEVWKIFNKLMAAGILKGLHIFKVQSEEIAEGDFIPTKGHFTNASSNIISFRTCQSFPHQIIDYTPYSPVKIEKKDLNDLINFFKNINKKFPNLQQRLLEAYSHYWNGQYDTSFILAYIIIEHWLGTKWKNTLVSIKDKKRREKLTNAKTGYWTDDRTIEILNIFKKLKDELYSDLMNLKKKRNNLVHGGITINKNDAEKCITLAHMFLLEIMEIKEPKQIKPIKNY